jgi:regulator of sirC expression with transglutaminase-like and TPR domain
MEEKEIKALIRLLDDNDSEVFEHIQSKLVTLGRQVIPILESAWSSSLDALMQERIENIIHRIQLDDVCKELQQWSSTGGVDLIKGAMLVARHQYADLNEQQILQTLDKIKKDAWLEMNPNLTALEQIKILNHIFFEVHGFSGNTQNYHAPQNSYINIALESKRGNPLMLAILYLEVALSVEIPVYGVNLPEHFILCYKDEQAMMGMHPEGYSSSVLFYINPFSKGDVFQRKEVEQFLNQLKLPMNNSFFEPCTNRDMIQRLIRNLSNSYQKLGFMEKVEELEMLMKATEVQ